MEAVLVQGQQQMVDLLEQDTEDVEEEEREAR